MSELGAFGDQHGFVTITPQGLGPIPRWETAVGSKDVKFIGDLLDQVEKTVCVDTARVFVTGLSNGAMMTSVVACALANQSKRPAGERVGNLVHPVETLLQEPGMQLEQGHARIDGSMQRPPPL